MTANHDSANTEEIESGGFESLAEQTRKVMEANWHPLGYTAPNPQRYEWQWLWDSCFHAIIWAELGEPERGVLELETLLGTIEPSGFLPHMNYAADPPAAEKLWGRSGVSTITQPPMFGYAIAEIVRGGTEVPEELISKAALGLRFFAKFRTRHPSGLVVLCHPWESGADDSPRWDSYYKLPRGHPEWQTEKRGFLAGIIRDRNGTPISNPAFGAASAGFTALVAFNIQELAAATGAIDENEADELVDAVENSWSAEHSTWMDAGDAEEACRSAPTLDAMLGVFADRTQARIATVRDDIFDESKFGGSYGPAGVAKQHPTYEGDGYWRGASWPQLSYLFAVAFRKHGMAGEAGTVSEQLKRGAIASGFAEYWNPDSGKGGGAIPQSWAGLAVKTLEFHE